MSVIGFGFVFGLAARNAGYSVIEASAMSVFAFAGAAQFAAVGYVAAGLPWAPIVVLTFFLNARHLLYSASLAPRLRGVPPARRAAMAHVLTDEAFALAAAHFHRLGRVDLPGYWIGAILGVFIPWNLATLAGVLLGGAIPDPSVFGLDVVFPAAMAGLAVGLTTGRRELVAAGAGGGDRDRPVARGGTGAGDRGRRAPRAAGRDGHSGGGRSRAGGLRRDRAGRRPGRSARGGRGTPAGRNGGGLESTGARRAARRPGDRPVTTQLVLLALLMAAVTYPSRALPILAPGIERLPPRALLYLRLVGPAVLASLAASNTLVATAADGTPGLHLGIEAAGVLACLALVAWRRNLLLGLIVAMGLVALARLAGVA